MPKGYFWKIRRECEKRSKGWPYNPPSSDDKMRRTCKIVMLAITPVLLTGISGLGADSLQAASAQDLLRAAQGPDTSNRNYCPQNLSESSNANPRGRSKSSSTTNSFLGLAPNVSDPVFNGLPLSAIFVNAVVATSRSPVYEISGGDTSLREAEDAVNAEYASPLHQFLLRNYCYDIASAFKKVSKDCHPGKTIGYVRPGFILASLEYKNNESAPVLFPKSIGGMRFGVIKWTDFSFAGSTGYRKWWNESGPDPLSDVSIVACPQFKPFMLTKNSRLLDPFSASEVILSNTEYTMSAAWMIHPANATKPAGFARNGGVLSVVETSDGLFLGYLTEKGITGLSALTWEQALSTNTAPFAIKPDPSKKELKTNTAIFSLFDADSRTQKRSPSSNPEDFLVFPEAYPEILQKGTWALKTSLTAPRGSGFEPIREFEAQTTLQYEVQRKLDRIQLQFDAMDKNSLSLLVISEFSTRDVERKVNATGGETIVAKPWRQKKEQASAYVGLSGDGAVRFTDGEKIYQIALGAMGKPQLTVFHIEKNHFK